MNKGMIMLGLLLIVGLSFATLSWQYDWQGYVFDRYDCNLQATDMYKFGFAAEYLYPSYASNTQMNNLNYALMDMQYYVLPGMAFDYYATPFRADMGRYNSASSEFNMLFNALIRNYLSQTGPDERELLMDWLQNYRGFYAYCLTGPFLETT